MASELAGHQNNGSAVLPELLIAELNHLTVPQKKAAQDLLYALTGYKAGPAVLPATVDSVGSSDEEEEDGLQTLEARPVVAASPAAKRPRAAPNANRHSPASDGMLPPRPTGPPYKRPRGQAPKGANGTRKDWDAYAGEWIQPAEEAVKEE